MQPRPSVFLSYRRSVSWELAEAVHGELGRRGFDVFMDHKSLGNGSFPTALLREIESRPQFVVLLQDGTLDRAGEEDDWLVREIAHALAHRRNVVPVIAGTLMPRPAELPSSIAGLAALTAIAVPPDYFREAMDRLEARLLGCLLDTSVLSFHLDDIGLGATLRWTTVNDATGFVVQRARDANFDAAREVYRGTDLEMRIRARRIGALRYRVRAEGTNGVVGGWSVPVIAGVKYSIGPR
ncbi:MAG: hypothetical protein QOK35_2190 [Pseudonocardiales bacterium]|nr:hypothetical protein [Pseudonocardiales bacterium]